MHKGDKFENLIFIHDGPIFYDDKGKFYEYSYHNLKERYGYIANNITFMIRTQPITFDTAYTEVPEEIIIKTIPNLNTPRTFFSERQNVKKLMEQEIKHADVLVIRGGTYASIAINYAKKFHKPYIYECVSCCWDGYWNHSLLGKLVAPYAYLRDKFLIRTSAYVYYVTNEFLQKRYPTKGISVGCSDVVIAEIGDEVLSDRCSRISTIGKRKISVGTAAAIDVRYKGQEYVIRAIKMLNENGYNIEYYLAGGNRKKSDYLMKIAKELNITDKIHFVGSLSAEQMRSFYDSLDIYIQPSLQEGMPRAVIEAMSRGCPVLGARTGGIPELISREFVFKRKSPRAIYNAILHLLDLDLVEIARRNIELARTFENSSLEQKRNQFYEIFVKNVKKE